MNERPTNIDFFAPQLPSMTEQRKSAIWGETPVPEVSEQPTSGGISIGDVVHFIPVVQSGTSVMCEEAIVEEVWHQAKGIVTLRLRDDSVLHRVGYSAEPLGNTWHMASGCEGRGTT